MKKQVVLTAVASLLTLASVAVLPAFAQDTGGTPFNSNKRSEQTWQHRGDRDQHGQSGYGYNRSDKGNYNYSSGSGYGYGSPTMSR